MIEPQPDLARPHLRTQPPAIVLAATFVIADQVESRDDFANSELAKDVESRWGAPVDQPAPSLRYVESGSIFTELKPLAFDPAY